MLDHLRGGHVASGYASTRIRGMGWQYVHVHLHPDVKEGQSPLTQRSEAYQLAMRALDQYRGTIVACRYCLSRVFPLPEAFPTVKASFHDAIARLVLAQPHLHVGITGENSKDPVLLHLNRLDLYKHIVWNCLMTPRLSSRRTSSACKPSSTPDIRIYQPSLTGESSYCTTSGPSLLTSCTFGTTRITTK